MDMEGNIIGAFKRPAWKYMYGTIRKPRSLLVLGDIMGSPCMNHSAWLTKLTTLNRHCAPLNGEESDGLGLSLIMQAQSPRERQLHGRLDRRDSRTFGWRSTCGSLGMEQYFQPESVTTTLVATGSTISLASRNLDYYLLRTITVLSSIATFCS